MAETRTYAHSSFSSLVQSLLPKDTLLRTYFIVHFNIKTNRCLCVCECIPDSLKMGTGRGGERSLSYIGFQMVACMMID